MFPFGRDQAIYAYAGKMLLEGKINYLYVFDLKPPGIHFLFAFIQLIMGESMLSARIFDLIWQCTTAFIMLVIIYKLTAEKFLSITLSVFYIFLYYRNDYWHTLQTDGSLNLLFAISVLLLLSNYFSHSFIKLFFAGIAFSAALLIKYTIILFLPLVIVLMLFDNKFILSLRIKNILLYSGGILISGLFILLLYYFTGALNAFWDIQTIQTPLYTKIAYETELQGFIQKQLTKLFLFSVFTPFIYLSIFAMLATFIKRKTSFPQLLLFIWVISALFSLIVQWKFYYYHFLVIIPPVLIASAIGFSYLKEFFKNYKKVYFSIAIVLLAAIFIYGFKPYLTSYSSLISFLNGKSTLKDEYIKNGFTSDSVFMISKTFKAVEYIKINSSESDNVFVWGFDPLIYYLSGRNCSSRFIYNFPLLWKGENTAFREEFIHVIEKNYPKIIIVAQNDPLQYISGYNEDSKHLLNRFPEFNKILAEKYNYRTNAEDYEIYELKSW